MTDRRWCFADQLGPHFLDDPEQPVLLVESRAVFARWRFHRRKAHLVLSALRHRAAELGAQVRFVRARTYRQALDEIDEPVSERGGVPDRAATACRAARGRHDGRRPGAGAPRAVGPAGVHLARLPARRLVDGYDWVMVPNVIGMSQHADGGLMATKPDAKPAAPPAGRPQAAGLPAGLAPARVPAADLSRLRVPAPRPRADDALAVVTTGGRPASAIREKFGDRLPANVRVAAFLPYHELLPKVDVMVTNGGYGGVHYALAHGVPLVVALADEIAASSPLEAVHAALRRKGECWWPNDAPTR